MMVHNNIEYLAKNLGGENSSLEVYCAEPTKELYRFRGLIKCTPEGQEEQTAELELKQFLHNVISLNS